MKKARVSSTLSIFFWLIGEEFGLQLKDRIVIKETVIAGFLQLEGRSQLIVLEINLQCEDKITLDEVRNGSQLLSSRLLGS